MEENKLVEESVYESLPVEIKNVTDLFEGREKDIVLLSCLGVLSGCIPNVFGIYDNKKVYSNIYVVIVAPPASGKGSMKFSRLIAEKIDNKLRSITEDENRKTKASKKGQIYEKYPQLMKFSPGNISSSEFYTHLKNNMNGLILFESEIDTLNIVLKNDWGNYSDLLRKAFHHETLSISRKTEEVFLKIENPRLSIVMSGTQDQLYSLIGSVQNGLFSRLSIYHFDEVQDFKDVFKRTEINYENKFRDLGNDVYELYKTLREVSLDGIEFEFSDNQEEYFFNTMSSQNQRLVDSFGPHINSIINRHALMIFRLAMVLTVFRKRHELTNSNQLICEDIDFKISWNLGQVLLSHSISLENSENGLLNAQDQQLYELLNDFFSRKEAIEVGKTLKIPTRTLDDKLKQFIKKGLIIQLKQGKYKKG